MRGQRGFTLIELMVSLVVASIAIGFIFRVYAVSSNAYRTQSQVSELQQIMRAAKQQIGYDLRMAGYNALNVKTMNNPTQGGFPGGGSSQPGGFFRMASLTVLNNNTAPDAFRVVYADSSCSARVPSTAAWSPGGTAITGQTPANCFAPGQLVLAIRTADGNNGSKMGDACLLQLNSASASFLGFSTSGPWDNSVQTHCSATSGGNGPLSGVWGDGQTIIMRVQIRAYRVNLPATTPPQEDPSPAGSLQMSPSGGMVTGDYQDLAFGFKDMQLAVQRYEEPIVSDSDADGDPAKNWRSGENMEDPLLVSGLNTLLQARVTLVGRTMAPVDGVGTTSTPNMLGNTALPDRNSLGDRASVTLPFGPNIYDYAYRSVSTIVDLRNIGANR